MNSHFPPAPRLAGFLLALSSLTAQAQPVQDAAPQPGLPAPVTDGSSGAIIDKVPRTNSIADPIPVPPVTRSPVPVVPPVVVDPAAGVVPNAPGATGPVLRPEIGRSGIDALKSAPGAGGGRNPANQAPVAVSPADAAQRQLMIEREDRMRGLKPRQP
ncbi:hypothetical protein RD110_23725 [Rhodoferax koreense]|uniref:Uncharacterized protein n=1 Tax=Rhodoferax koreensis TaxID=1842727 RepID=A0A1P8K1G7_9BURK|nr:hypothetical protein [Rhodoferax koreense]APW39839.1 hypothetical protein RD110_23725 [Rhodoferax koreense]